MRKKNYRDMRLSLYQMQLANGLRVFLIPKPGFTTFCGVLAVDFGAAQSQQYVYSEGKKRQLKRGIAHFLEHRLFENTTGPVFDIFSNRGASVNAYTSFYKTLYYFTSSNQVLENVASLLDFVQQFSVDEVSVEKEKKIIIEELKMYDDIADFRLHKGILRNLYHQHEIKHDIGGEVEDVKGIDAALLAATHQAFYHPTKMYLTVVGDFHVENMRDFIVHHQAHKEFKKGKIKVAKQIEPLEVACAFDQEYFSVSADKACYGMKLPPLRKNMARIEKAKYVLAYDLLLQLMFSSSNSFYSELLEQKVITADLQSYYDQGIDYRHVLISADVYDIAVFTEKIKNHLQQFVVNEKEFETLKRQAIGKNVREGENPARLALDFGDNIVEGFDILEELKLLKKLQPCDLDKVLCEIRQAQVSVYAIKKEEKS